MKTKILFITILIPFIIYANEPTGREIAEMVDKANQSEKGMIVKGKMILKDLKSDKTEERSYIILSVKANQSKRLLFRFTSSFYKGTTFLTIEDENKNKLHYIYLTSIGSPRQIEASEKEKNFLDTDVSNEELGGSNIDDYEYKRLPDTKIGNIDCYVIERTPKRKDSKYKNHIVTIDKERLIPLEVKMFTKDNRLSKIIKMDDIRKISEKIYTPFKTVVIDTEKRHQTIISIEDAKEQSINLGYFNKNRMGRKWDVE